MASYQTIRKLSDGAAADVFLAQGEGSTEPVILELMRPHLTAHGDLVNQFLGEARLRSQMEHPNLAKRVRGGKTRDGRYYVVTEPIRGESLRSHLKAQGALTASEVLELTVPLCRALAYLHGCGVVHKNLTAANVFLPGGLKAMQPKLFDASLALLRAGRATTPKHGVCVVEAAYMAPERVGGQRADARSDIYSLGVLMREALTGRVPLPDGRPLPPEQGALGEVIARATARNPAARYESAAAMRDDLIERCRHTLVLETDAIEHSPKTRETLGAYELLEMLGEGAMGTVYRARHTQLGREVALKVMRADAASNPRLVKRCRDEARAVNRINHPHIVEVVDFCEAEPETGSVFCVMEL
ncbi:MAG TPA: protein kinase, partial [Myxococcaceae bacterium]|nr:protein kinase [Myxococcaceae bacterium]